MVEAKVVYHLAGVNRSDDDAQFVTGNVGSLEAVFAALDTNSERQRGSHPLLVLSSSAQASRDTAYGRSKLAAEGALAAFCERLGASGVIYRLPGVFGKWCRPHYNSVVATFCHNAARGLPISIFDPAKVIELVHVDDVIRQFMTHLEGDTPATTRMLDVRPTFKTTVEGLAERIQGFRRMRETLLVPDVGDPFVRRLLGTYTSYLPAESLAYSLARRTDARGTLAELLKAPSFGQIFVSRTLPGVTRGNHYHDLKIEKFCVLDGHAVVRFRDVLGDDVVEHAVSGAEFKVVDIPPGMTHSIENVGSTELVVLFWASEIFDVGAPDTHPVEVLRG
jgi:UDP-2-acetamido-2,6-beta-L-arabino-hexul-4-ose reductase